MRNQQGPNQVYRVKSLDEMKRILLSVESFKIGNELLRVFLTVWVFLANCSLWMLKFILFKKWGYTKREFRDIVVYTVGIVGDNIVMLPALAAIRDRYPTATITVITNCQIWDSEGAMGVLGPSPDKDRLIVLNDHPVKRRGFRLWMDRTAFNGITCDLFVNLSPFGNRGWIGAVVREMIFAKKLGAKYAVGFYMSTYARKDIFNKVQYQFLKNEPRRAKEVLKKLGLTPVENEDLLIHDPEAKESVIKKIKEQGADELPLFVINPGAKFKAKCWPTEYFGTVANWLSKHYNLCVVVTGIASEEGIANEVIKASGDIAINLAGKTNFQELVELLRIAKGCITNDTGTMHIAAMVGIPTVALFSLRFSPTHWLPVGHNIISVFSIPDCLYCYKDSCKTLDCLENIRADDVILALKQLMNLA